MDNRQESERGWTRRTFLRAALIGAAVVGGRMILPPSAFARDLPEGRLTFIEPGQTPCLRCLVPEAPPAETFPALGATPGVIASLQVTEVAPYSQAYFQLVRALPEIAQALSVGDEVLVAGRRASIKVTSAGAATWRPGQLQSLVRAFRGV